MVSLIKKFKQLYKGSYFYANKKYGKYTKRRPFPNFDEFDCSPSGDFSMNEVPTTTATNSVDYIKNNNNNINYYITNENSNNITEINPTTGDILGISNEKGLYYSSNSVSPVTTDSDDYTVVNPNVSRQSYAPSESSFTVTFDGMSDNNNDDDIKVNYNGKNNWSAEIKRYYPSIPRVNEIEEYPNDSSKYQNNVGGMDINLKNLTKKKWWKKVISHKKNSSKHQFDSTIKDNTYYYNDDNGYSNKYDYEYNPTRYDSSRHSDIYFNKGFKDEYKYNYVSRYDEDLTEGVLVVNENVGNNLLY